MNQLTHAANEARRLTIVRDTWIVSAHQEGYSLREIGLLAGMHHTSVMNILKKAKLVSEQK